MLKIQVSIPELKAHAAAIREMAADPMAMLQRLAGDMRGNFEAWMNELMVAELSLHLAHLKIGGGRREHLLEDHLRAVGARASAQAGKFESAGWGDLAGRWHDLGKYRPAFQAMIRAASDENTHLEDRTKGPRVDHSSPGALHAEKLLGPHGRPLALCIAGHHTGLRDMSDWVDRRSHETAALLHELPTFTIPPDILGGKSPGPPAILDLDPTLPRKKAIAKARRRLELWTRMLFSALVDGDFLDTEKFYSPDRTAGRAGFPSVVELGERLRTHLDKLSADSAAAERRPSRVNVNAVRREVLERCRLGAAAPPGIFSLTVPTGGGKTLASLAFALDHVQHHDLDRVIVVAPYLTIIDQTVDAFERALRRPGEELPFIEHHSLMEANSENARNRLAAENWDSPLVVTTAVQFFESLFSRRSSQCRKLHNVARSVVIIDEAQTLPSEFLLPIIEVLQTLVDCFGASVVLSTATQPELRERKHPNGIERVPGFRSIAEINEPHLPTFAALRRVRTERFRTASWDAIATRLVVEPKVLAITHLRNDARELAEQVERLRPDETLYHLSALMCAAHRRQRVSEIREALESSEIVRVVSTQLVEAGVDLDFPVVFRAMAGLDALAQSAGRCNREGRLAEGRLVVFDAPTRPPVGTLRTAADAAAALFVAKPDLDPLDPEIYRQFDARLFRVRDEHNLQPLREQLAFEQVAETFKLVDDGWQTSIIVPWESETKAGVRQHSYDLLAQVEAATLGGWLRLLSRRLQPYSVSISRRQAAMWQDSGVLREVGETFLALSPQYLHLYDAVFGLCTLEKSPAAEPHALIG